MNRFSLRRSFWITALAVAYMGPTLSTAVGANANSAAFELSLRKKTPTAPGSDRFHTVWEDRTWNAKQTAVIVCDMWDLHHCLNATRRGGEMAPRMNELLNNARSRGALIIHAPSSCMETYAQHPARLRAVNTPKSKNLPVDIGKWCHKIPAEEQGQYPIDQTDGGEDDDPQEHAEWAQKLESLGRNPRAPWKSQMEQLEIRDEDVISDNGEEIWSVMEERGIKNVMLVGVHTNMCVLGRPFGLRQMSKNGKNVVLVRDMTDTMYNPQRTPFVSHFTGTDLIVDHIEKWVCPTITSDQILGGRPFTFQHDKRPHLVVIMAEGEYKTHETLPKFALSYLGKTMRVSHVFANDQDPHDLPGIRLLEEADAVLISVRRRVLPEAQMAVLRKFIESGKPVVAVRTANHAFSLNGKEPPEGSVAWEQFDREVIGGNYTGHYGVGPAVEVVKASDEATRHPILQGVDLDELRSHGSLYKVSPLAPSAQPLLLGNIPDQKPEPVAWVNTSAYGGRVFYMSIAHPDDFASESINRLLANAVHWAVKPPVSE